MAQSPERKNTRMGPWDYSSAGWYFVTICVKHRSCVFGDIRDGKMKLNNWGKIAHQCWEEIPDHFENITINQFIVMPNHVHGIVVIEDFLFLDRERRSKNIDREKACLFPTGRTTKGENRRRMKLSNVIGSFKSSVTRKINQQSLDHFAWQSSFHDHIIRNQKELENIQKYIYFNAEREHGDLF